MPSFIARIALYFSDALRALFLSAGSVFSLTSLLCALSIAIVLLVIRRRARQRPVGVALLLRALFPKRLLTNPSTRADLICLAANVFVYGGIFVGAVLSTAALAGAVADALTVAFGRIGPLALPAWVQRSAITLILFLAYELGYWIDHYLSHRLPILWEFHKVHHSAEVLTPLTVWRTHPLDSLVFYNVLALVMGLTDGIVVYAFGTRLGAYAIAGNNLLLVLAIHAYVHLQHSHLWIAFRGWAGRVFMSPAHHQIHHSMNPRHFNRNFGASLAVWDWAFRTLHMPARDPERLTFGIAATGHDVNTIGELSIAPIGRALALLKPKLPGRLPGLPNQQPSRM